MHLMKTTTKQLYNIKDNRGGVINAMPMPKRVAENVAKALAEGRCGRMKGLPKYLGLTVVAA